MRIVLDTNALISAFLFGGKPEKLVLNALGGSDTIVISPYIITETNRMLAARFGTAPHTLKLFQRILSDADLVYFEPFIHVLGDEPDNRIIETAVVGNADYIVTRDKLLLSLKSYKQTKIVTVAEYLK